MKLLLTTLIERKSERIAKLSREDADRKIVFKARVHHVRAMSKHIVFLVFRQSIGTIQGVLTDGETVSQNMLLWAETIHNESIVWVEGLLQIPQNDQHEVKSSSVCEIEVKIEKVCDTPEASPTRGLLGLAASRVITNSRTAIPSRRCFTSHH
jgi:aspartyl/asparaginyl-tRNA synthetase